MTVAMAGALATLAGCPRTPKDDEIDSNVGNVLLGMPTTRPVTVVRVTITAVELPLDTNAEGDGFWSSLSEKPFNPATPDRLAVNGIRVGVGLKKNWDALADSFNAQGGRTLKASVLMVMANKVAPIVISSSKRRQTIFTILPDQTLRGVDYPPGMKQLAIHCVPNDSESLVTLTAMPQLRSFKSRIGLSKTGARHAVTRTPDFYNFYSLGWRLAMSPKEFLVMGPSSEAERTSSAGRHFFTHKSMGMDFQTLLVITAEMHQMVSGKPREAPAMSKPLALPEPLITQKKTTPATRPAKSP